ncbi:hypothetical protein BK634_09585 [Pseudomonas chlororaphis]|jgi:uncharacterized membrane protein|nr:hypothetical protein BK634_09585 [Pseudomonas chlororaphis]
MIGGGSMTAFFARYFPTFMGTVLLGCFSASGLLSLAGTTYWRGLEPSVRTDYLGLAVLFLVLLLVAGHFLMLRGRSWAVWLVTGYFLLCLALVLPMFAYGPHQGVYLVTLLLPLLGLLLLNSKRHREMRGRLLEIRHERERIIHAAKQKRSSR